MLIACFGECRLCLWIAIGLLLIVLVIFGFDLVKCALLVLCVCYLLLITGLVLGVECVALCGFNCLDYVVFAIYLVIVCCVLATLRVFTLVKGGFLIVVWFGIGC